MKYYYSRRSFEDNAPKGVVSLEQAQECFITHVNQERVLFETKKIKLDVLKSEKIVGLN